MHFFSYHINKFLISTHIKTEHITRINTNSLYFKRLNCVGVFIYLYFIFFFLFLHGIFQLFIFISCFGISPFVFRSFSIHLCRFRLLIFTIWCSKWKLVQAAATVFPNPYLNVQREWHCVRYKFYSTGIVFKQRKRKRNGKLLAKGLRNHMEVEVITWEEAHHIWLLNMDKNNFGCEIHFFFIFPCAPFLSLFASGGEFHNFCYWEK